MKIKIIEKRDYIYELCIHSACIEKMTSVYFSKYCLNIRHFKFIMFAYSLIFYLANLDLELKKVSFAKVYDTNKP